MDTLLSKVNQKIGYPLFDHVDTNFLYHRQQRAAGEPRRGQGASSQLFRLLTSCDEVCEYSCFKELVAEIFECLKDQLAANVEPLLLCGGVFCWCSSTRDAQFRSSATHR